MRALRDLLISKKRVVKQSKESAKEIILQAMLLLSLLLLFCNAAFASSFYEDRYNNWIYFNEEVKREALEKKEEKERAEEKKKKAFAKAKKEVELFSRELEELKFMMIRYPENLEYVAAYKKKEALMFDGAMKLDYSYRLVNAFTDPENIDLINNSTNLYGRKIRSEIVLAESKLKIKELADQVELFFVFSASCPYSKQAEPVLKQFVDKYGFKLVAVSIDDGSATGSNLFKTYFSKELVKQLGVQTTPVVVAVTNDSSIRFEFIRGALSMSELEERGALALDYLTYLNNKKEVLNENFDIKK